MEDNRPIPSEDEWLHADQPGPPLTTRLRQRRGLIVGALALALLLAVIVVGGRRAAPLGKPAAAGPSSPTGLPFFGLFPVFAYDAGHRQVVLLNFRDQTWLWASNQWGQGHPSGGPPPRAGPAAGCSG